MPKVKFLNYECTVVFDRYHNGRIALRLAAGPYNHIAVASVNLPKEPCPEGEIWIKDYSENTSMVDALTKAGVIDPMPTAITRSGFVTIGRYRLNT